MTDKKIPTSIHRDEVDAVIRDLHSIKKLYVDSVHVHTRARINTACTIMQALLDERESARVEALREAAMVALDHQTFGNDLMDTEIGRNAASTDIHDAIMGLVRRTSGT